MRIQIMQSDGEGKAMSNRQAFKRGSEPPSLPLSELTASGLRFKLRQDVKLHYVLTPSAVLSRKREAK